MGSRTLLEQSDRGRRQAEADLADAHEQLQTLSNQNSSLSLAKRKMEGELHTMQADLADMLRAEQDHAQAAETTKKSLEAQVKDITLRLEETETVALKSIKRNVGKLEGRVRELETQFDDEARRHADAQKNLRKAERRIKELSFQSEEDKKNHERMQDLVDKLQQKIKTYKRQIDEAEEIAAMNLAKYRKAQGELEQRV